MSEVDRKKPFSSLEKVLFLNILQKYDAIVSSKQTNAKSALKKKHSWEKIKEEFNKASIVSQRASTKQLIKLWYNMKAKARQSKKKENVDRSTGRPPAAEMDPLDVKVMDINKNILTNVMVDIDSDIDGSVLVLGDSSNEAWCKRDVSMQATQEAKEESNIMEHKTIKNSYEYKIDLLKCKILEEELEFKKKLHEEELKIKVLERLHKEKLFKIELEIKLKELNNK